MKSILSTFLFVLFAAGTPSITVAQFVPNDEVELLRDEPLLFNTSVYRQGQKGERFRIAAYRADSHKIFLFATDANGKTFALSVPDAAVGPVGKDIGMLNDQAFAALRAGRLDDAQKLMLQVSMMDRERNVCAEIATHLGRISTAQVAYQQGLNQQQATQAEMQRRLKNAAVVDRPNALDRSDNSNQVRAQQMRNDASELAKKAEASIKSKQEQIVAELKLLSEVARKCETAHAYSEALDISDAVVMLASLQPGRGDRSDSFRGFGRQELEKKAKEAQKHLEDARRHVGVKKLSAALQSLGAGLGAEPGSYSLRRLQGEVSQRLEASGKAYANAVALQQLKHYEDALKILEKARAECTDHDASETLAAAVKKTIAEKEDKTAKAKTAEAAGNFASALETYETYAMDSDSKRVLPQYANQRETEGDFLLAYSLYEKAGMSAEMQRVQAKKEQQLSEYGKARVFLVEGKFPEALAIYRRYKDTRQEKDAIRQQGAFYEGQGEYDEAMRVYGGAQLADEVVRVKTFVITRDSLMSEGRQQELAANFEKAIELFQKADARDDVRRVAGAAAKRWEDKKDYNSAVTYYETAGMYEEAGRVRKAYDISSSVSLRKLSDQEIVKSCGPACVTVLSGGRRGVGLGSGFFVAKGGYILTNMHVIKGAATIGVLTAANEAFEATLVESSEVPDLALLKVELKEHPIIKLGDSDKVESGAHVAAIGSPKGNSQSFTAGSISNANRTYRDNKCFQISVLINHGNSGGPLLDEMGQAVGVNTFGEGTAFVTQTGKSVGSDIQGINYAIKINEAKKVFKDILAR